MTYGGKFADSLVADQLEKLSVSFLVDELEIRRYLDMAERMFSAIRRELYEGGGPHRIQK